MKLFFVNFFVDEKEGLPVWCRFGEPPRCHPDPVHECDLFRVHDLGNPFHPRNHCLGHAGERGPGPKEVRAGRFLRRMRGGFFRHTFPALRILLAIFSGARKHPDTGHPALPTLIHVHRSYCPCHRFPADRGHELPAMVRSTAIASPGDMIP